MRVAVIGAGGFVGCALVARLREDGHEILPIVRTPAGLAGEVKIGDLVSADWPALLRDVDAVAHLAARVHIMKDGADDPLAAFRLVNRDGAVAAFRGAASAGVRRFVFVSTVKVNGEATQPGVPFGADDTPAPKDPYGISKAEAETALRALAAQCLTELSIIRPTLVYGPGVRANFRTLMDAVRRGFPLPLGRTDNRRSLVGIDNLVDLIALCLHHPEAVGQIFMASDGRDVSTSELLRLVGQAVGRPARLLPVPPRLLAAAAGLLGRRAAADRVLGSLQVDIGKNREILGWEPPVSLEIGLRRTASAAN